MSKNSPQLRTPLPFWIMREIKKAFTGLLLGISSMIIPNCVQIRWTVYLFAELKCLSWAENQNRILLPDAILDFEKNKKNKTKKYFPCLFPRSISMSVPIFVQIRGTEYKYGSAPAAVFDKAVYRAPWSELWNWQKGERFIVLERGKWEVEGCENYVVEKYFCLI